MEQQRSRSAKLQEQLRAFKEASGCLVCAESDPICLELHHTDPTSKEIEPADMAGSGWSWTRMLTEISKCVVLCSNCHKKVHNGRFSLVP